MPFPSDGKALRNDLFYVQQDENSPYSQPVNHGLERAVYN